MARVTYGSMITELKGSVGGITFHRNSSGPIARLRPKPPVNPSQLQSNQQQLLSYLVSMWGALSLSDKDSWDTMASANNHYTPWGEEKTLSGYQWFLSCNLNRLFIGDTIVETCPGYTSVAAPATFTLEATSDDFTIEWDPEWTPEFGPTLILATAPIRQNSLKVRRPGFFLEYHSFSAVSSYSIKSLYEAAYNLTWADFFASANCSIIVRLRQLDDDYLFSSSYTNSIIKIS
jgi:hypothetical protein